MDINKNSINENTKVILIAANHNYLYPAMVLLTSLFHNHRDQDMQVFLLHTDMETVDQSRLLYLASRWSHKKICMIHVDESMLDGLKAFGRFSVEAFFRILGMELLPASVNQVLYLDVDMIVKGDLSELFEQPTKQFSACYDICGHLMCSLEEQKKPIGLASDDFYFNSGMLLMYLDDIREHKIKERICDDLKENFDRYSSVDQDALNKIYKGKVYHLPWQIYNCPCIPYIVHDKKDIYTDSDFIDYGVLEETAECAAYIDVTEDLLRNAKIMHFCTIQKPWRDRECYNHKNMRYAMQQYERYESLLKRQMRDWK